MREISGPVGVLETRLDVPPGPPRAVAVIAHPHTQFGGTLQTRAVYEAAQAFVRMGVAALRFNFRGAGNSAGSFDDGRGEQDDYRAALDAAAAKFPGLPIWAVGMSFGAWVATTVGDADPRVSVLLAIAPAVDHYEYAALKTSAKHAFVIHGELDELAPVRHVRRLYSDMREPKDLVVIEGAGHVFEGQTSVLAETIGDLLGDFETGNTKTRGHEDTHENNPDAGT